MSEQISVERLSFGIYWACCPFKGLAPQGQDSIASAVAAVAQSNGNMVSPAAIAEAIRLGDHGRSEDCYVMIPETSLDLGFLRWDGDGHFDLSRYKGEMPPTLGQIVQFLLQLEKASFERGYIVFLSSNERRATACVLAGATLMMMDGYTAEEAWAVVRRSGPPISADPSQAWDRFPTPFSVDGVTHESSLRILDCLLGLQAARRLGWFQDFRSFDVEGWHLLRRKFDASWVIPRELLAMANPSVSSENPAFPGLLPLPSSNPLTVDLKAVPRGMSDASTGIASPKSSQREESEDSANWELYMEEEVADEREFLTPTSRTVTPQESSLARTPVISPPRQFGLTNMPRNGSDPSFNLMSTLASNRARSGSDPAFAPRTETDTADEDSCETLPERVRRNETKRTTGTFVLETSQVSVETLQQTATFVDLLHHLNVGHVARLNEDKEVRKQGQYVEAFSKSGIECLSYAFEDMKCPSKEVVSAFLKQCKKIRSGASGNSKAVGIHCKAGLGRTGVMMASYAVQFHVISGNEFLGWVRLCRPGSVQNRAQETFIRSLSPGQPYGSTAPSALTRQQSKKSVSALSQVDDDPTSENFFSAVMSPLLSKRNRFPTWPLFGNS